ncbi:hypothetical protein ST47_g1880 [Ascochyta rabiei]|uniref:Uncharacterized protein n=1 Tax=Didymella rabiei TaxID=5454 RepID=A0A163KF34_DIDRA|nr:hypothetical protein ST47_g1880 [Ascochyta rabiei]
MVWTQPRASFNNRLPNRRPSPTRTLKDIRCFECQVATPPGIHHTRHLHHDEFAPTPNRFSILAELDTSPETKWAFDFVPTSTSVRKRRGKRGSKQQRHRHTLEKTRKDLKPDGLDAICDELVALHPDDSEPAVASQEPNYKMSEGFTSSVNAVRHHWAPQFRPNSLPTSNPNKQPETLQQKSQYSQSPSTLVKDPSIDILPSNRKIHTRFSPSAFLKDLVSLNDCVGDWPPRNSSPEPTFPLRISKACNTPTIVTTATLTQPATAACRAPVLSRTTTPPFSHTVRMHLAGSTTPVSLNNTAHSYSAASADDLHDASLPPSTIFASGNNDYIDHIANYLQTVCQINRSTSSFNDTAISDNSSTASVYFAFELAGNVGRYHRLPFAAAGPDYCTRRLPLPVCLPTTAMGINDLGDSQLSHNLPDLQDDIESSSSDSDAVLLTPSSESSWSVFEDLMTLNQGSQPIAFDDDGWVAVSSHGQGRRSSSLSSPSASDTQVLTPDHVTNPTSPVNLLPSLPQTPLMSAYQARVSDIESKMD